MKQIKRFPILVCICLMIGLFAGCGVTLAQDGNPSASASPAGVDVSADELSFAENYDDIYKAIQSALSRTYGPSGHGVAMDSATVAESAAPMPETATTNDSMGFGGKGEYSETNVQVEGVDEGDIVKTDGEYIYVLRENELIIFKADGETTTQVSAIKVVSGYSDDTDEMELQTTDYASDIYVTGDTAVVVLSRYSYSAYVAEETPEDGRIAVDIAPYGVDKQISMLRIYDITNRAEPVLKGELGQDGNVLTTRLIGSTLYMITTYYVYDAREDNDGSYIPSVYANGTPSLMKAGDIAIMPYIDTTSHTVLCAYNLDDAALSASQSILSGGSTVYMNADTLYIAESTSRQTAGTPYTQSVYTVTDYTRSDITNITSFDISGGTLALKATGTVSGSLHNQFNLDEYDGNLRVVTSVYTQAWTEYTDEEMDWTNYIWDDGITDNALYVLDGSLSIIGSIDTLSEDEQVYGVRFDGETGYIVTFRQVDPLFAVDLSDPTNPTVMSALKIPGFSEYLHVYSDGRLFGLGMDADEETGRTSGMKLTMFNTEDPTDVTVKHTLKLDSDYSVALYNHKAILISADKSIIAFPADNGYDIYGYKDDTGFYKRASINIDAVDWYGNGRGLYIDDFAYIVNTRAVTVLDLKDFSLVTQLAY